MSSLPPDPGFEAQLGIMLAGWRTSRSLSQEALAEQLGVVQSHVSRVERGQIQLTVVELLAWLDVLDLDRLVCLGEVEAAWAAAHSSLGSLWPGG